MPPYRMMLEPAGPQKVVEDYLVAKEAELLVFHNPSTDFCDAMQAN